MTDVPKTGERLVGQVAKRQAVPIREHHLLDQAVHGPPVRQVSEEMKMVPYASNRTAAGCRWSSTRQGAEENAAGQISAMVLEKLRTPPRNTWGGRSPRRSLPFPPISTAQRQATKEPRTIAGWK
jgi:molecular chaperone DnaK (HSP70)